jgi:hypothetical protein
MFRENSLLKNVSALKNLRMNKNTDFGCMFMNDSNLENIGSILSSWGNNAETGTNTGLGGSNGVCGMFTGCSNLSNVHGIALFLSKLKYSGSSVAYMFAKSGVKSLLAFAGAITNRISIMTSFLWDCRELEDLTGAETWDMSSVTIAYYMLYSLSNYRIKYPPSNLNHIAGWKLNSMSNPSYMIGVRYTKSTERTLDECDQLVQTSLNILSNWDLPGSDYIFKHYFNQPNQGYEIVYRHYGSSSYIDMAL